jgi:FMN phosphatase YigB (HAD superfamily)
VRTVLFDIGGVLTVDPWQTLLLTPQRGIADRLGLDRDSVSAAGERLWPRYSSAPEDEQSYWHALQETLGHEIPTAVVREVEAETLRPNPAAKPAIDLLEAGHVSWGIISDNTTFWYRKELDLLGLTGRVGDALEFVSFRYGRSKSSESSLFEIAARRVEPEHTVVVDDRQPNLARADRLGFQTKQYSMYTDTGEDLLDLLRRSLDA